MKQRPRYGDKKDPISGSAVLDKGNHRTASQTVRQGFANQHWAAHLASEISLKVGVVRSMVGGIIEGKIRNALFTWASRLVSFMYPVPNTQLEGQDAGDDHVPALPTIITQNA